MVQDSLRAIEAVGLENPDLIPLIDNPYRIKDFVLCLTHFEPAICTILSLRYIPNAKLIEPKGFDAVAGELFDHFKPSQDDYAASIKWISAVMHLINEELMPHYLELSAYRQQKSRDINAAQWQLMAMFEDQLPDYANAGLIQHLKALSRAISIESH